MTKRLEYEGHGCLVPDVQHVDAVCAEVFKHQLGHREQVGKHDHRASTVGKSLTHLGVENAVGFNEPLESCEASPVFLHVALVPPLRRLPVVVLGEPTGPDHPRRGGYQLVDELGEVVDVGGVLAECHLVECVAEGQQDVWSRVGEVLAK